MPSSRLRLRLRLPVAFSALIVGACASEPTPKKVDVPPAQVVAPPTMAFSPSRDAAAALVSTTGPRALEPVTRPQAIACKLTSASWAVGTEPSTSAALAFAPGKPPFVDLGKGSVAEVHISEASASAPSSPPDIFVSAQMGSMLIEGTFVSQQSLELHPAKAFQAMPYLAPLPHMRMTLEGSGKGTLRAQLDVPTGLTLVKASDSLIERPCDHLGLDVVKFDPAQAWGAASPKVLKKLSAIPRHVDLLDAPSGTKVAELVVDKNRPPSVLEEKSGHSLVLWSLDTAVVRAWVKSSQLSTPLLSGAYGVGGGGGMRQGKLANANRKRSCSSDIPLIVQQGLERRIVGKLKAGTTMHLLDSDTDDVSFTEIHVNQNGVFIKDGCKLLVRNADIENCTRE